MARDGGSRLTAVCFLASYIWLSCSLQRHHLSDDIRLSSFLLLFISGTTAYIASLFSKWLPGADGRFDSEAALKGMQSSIPHRPRRFYVPCIIFLVLFRLELSYRIIHYFECTTEGVEALLPVILAAHEFLSHRIAPVASDEPEEMWGSPLEDFKDWVVTSPISLLISTIIFSYGVFMVDDSTLKSTFFCTTLGTKRSLTVLSQWAGVFIDAVVLIMLWRVLSWARTTKARLRVLSLILLLTSVGTLLLWIGPRIMQPREIISHHSFSRIGPLYLFDAFSTGLLISALIISTALWACDSTILEPTAIATFASGLLASIQKILSIRTYEQPSAGQPLTALFLISCGFMYFTYAHNMRWVVVFKRKILLLLLAFIIIASTAIAVFKHKHIDRHPVDELVYRRRVEADRWLRHATVSTTLKLAVAEYKDRHQGRDPPPNFDKWFEFAQQRKSVIIDKFDQIEKDILPFWGMKPQKIQEGLEKLSRRPEIGIIKIANGRVSHGLSPNSLYKGMLDDTVSMISTFAEHLPSMTIAINLQERPRILVPWDDVHRLILAGSKGRFQLLSRLPHKREEEPKVAYSDNPNGASTRGLAIETHLPAWRFRQLKALACPPGSAARGGVHWDVRDFCSSCVKPHSQGQFLDDWEMYLNPCHQPDVFNLHDFHTTPHLYDLHQELLPLFSRSKTDSFSDILIPLTHTPLSDEPDTISFDDKKEIVFWQDLSENTEVITPLSLYGGHQHRLVHLANNASAADKVTMVLGIHVGDKDKFQYEEVRTAEANGPLPFEFSFATHADCNDIKCDLRSKEFGRFREAAANGLENRYVMLLDGADGPPRALLQTLRSNSVPVLSSIFREWYTERLMPWVHFVPVDLRYHALHSTLAYFVGLRNRGLVNGRQPPTEGRKEDARWIAEEGRKWADKAIRREDMEVYMFRLLLEWGRVINEDRDNLGFVL